MRVVPSIRAALAALVLVLADGAVAREIALTPDHRPGETYDLSIETTTRTEAEARRSGGGSFEERVRLVYRARVEVLEVGPDGRPTRERHEGVRLSYQRPDGAGSLFPTGTRFEVRRDADGRVRLFEGDARLAPGIEAAVAPLLERQLEHTLAPELLRPGRPVSMGERWELSERVARRLLRDAGLRSVDFDGPPTAMLVPHESDAGLVSIRYRIPIARCEVDDAPENLRTSRSSARLEGRIDLTADADARPVAHVSSFELELAGSVRAGGAARPFPWHLARVERAEQRVERLAAAAPPASPAP
jgi:hypothetical protein